MASTIFNWIVVFEDGSTKECIGDTPEVALEDIDYSEQHNIVAIIRNGY